MVKLLLDYGAVLQTRTYNALSGAVQFNHSDIVKLLLDHGADPNGRFKQSGSKATEVNMRPSPLRVAAMKGHRDIVKLQLDYGADCYVQDELGRTALDWALMRDHQEVANLFQEYFGFEREQVNLEELKGNERYYEHIPGRYANFGTSTEYQR